jgi:hypothetical protein
MGFGGDTGPALSAATEEFNISTSIITPAAWSSGANMSTARYGGGSAGATNSALFAGGFSNTLTTYYNLTEEYDGATWTAGGTTSGLGQSSGGGGTQTAAWISGREPAGPIVATEEYDGSTWTAGGNLNTSSAGSGGCGIQTAASFARRSQDHEQYDGTSWTASTDSPTNRGGTSQAGTQTANIMFGGEDPGGTYLNLTTEWNGSSWTTGGNMIYIGGGFAAGVGPSIDAMQVQGYSPQTSPNRMATVSVYDGTAWSNRPSLSTGRGAGGASTASASSGSAITFTGTTGTPVANTEEFNGETSAKNYVDITTS